MATNEQYFAAIIMSIIATGTFIGLVNLAYNDKFPDLSNTGAVIPSQPTFSSPTFTAFLTSGIFIQGQSFTNTSGYDPNISVIKGGLWAQDSGGYHLLSDDYINNPLIVIRNVISNSNIYTVSYVIDNTPDTDFYITPRHLSGMSVSDLRLEFKSDGIYIPKYPLIAGFFYNGYDYFFPLPNSQRTIPGGSTIVTTLTDVSNGPGDSPDTAGKNSLLSVSKDGTPLFSVYVRDLVSGATTTDVLQYAGAGSHSPGFTIVSINAPIQYTPNTVTLISSKDEGGLIAGAIAFLNLLSSFLSGVGLFLSSMGTILGYSISSDICPVWVTAIVMTPQIAGLVLIVVKILRGTS